jgi:AbrB family looped-hinge helix DNA binding protein
MSTVMKISPQGQIRIPKTVLASLRIAPGDYFEISIENNQVVLKPRKLIDPSQNWYWSKNWQQSEAEVDKDLADDQCSPLFQTAEEGLKWLNK